jgi:MFS family permease
MYAVSLGHGATHWIQGTFYTLLPFVTSGLGLSYTEAGLLVSAFFLSSFLANVPSGVVVDMTGRRVPFQVASIALGAIALAGFSLAPGYAALAALVAAIGATNMLWHPAAISYLSIRYPDRRGYALAIHGLGANLGDAAAPLAAGALLLALDWRAASVVGAAPVAAFAAIFALALGRADAAAAPPPPPLSRYLRGMGALLGERATWTLCSVAAFRTMAQSGMLAFLPLYLSHDLAVNPFWMGFALMALQAGGAVAAPAAGLVSDRVGRRPVVLAGIWASTVAIFALTFVTSAPAYIAGVALLGFFMYAVRPVIHGWMMDLSPPELGASVTSLVFGAQAALTTAMPVVGGFLADRFGLLSVFYFLAASMLTANALALLVPAGKRRPPAHMPSARV